MPEVIARFDGRYLVRGGDLHAMEGAPALKRLAVLEFPDRKTARAFFDSADYAPLLKRRPASTRSDVVPAEGYTG